MNIQARYRLSAASARQQVDSVLTNIKKRIPLTDEEYLRKGWNKNLCHNRVARAIRDRSIPTDIVWLYGDGVSVAHSVLTDQHNKVIVGAKMGNNRSEFMAERGFLVSPEVGIYELMKKIKVKDL